MANCWDVLSKLASNASAREVGDVTQTASPTHQQLLDQISYLHCQQINLLAELSQLRQAYSDLSMRNAMLCQIIALEEGEGDAGDDGDYYVAGSPVISRRTH